MVKKSTLLGAAIHIILLMSFSMTTAQQRDPVKESLYFQLPESATKTPDANALTSPNVRDLSSTEFSTNPLRSPNRTYDGTNNNLGWNRKAWGSANIPLLREMPAVYGANNSLAGSNRPSPRAVSNLVVDEPVTIFNARNLSTVVYLWGQFLDHDITLTPTGTTESVPIQLPPDEELFTEPISFFRSAVYPGTGVTTPREQINLNTAWIDASTVYGSDEPRARWLRT